MILLSIFTCHNLTFISRSLASVHCVVWHRYSQSATTASKYSTSQDRRPARIAHHIMASLARKLAPLADRILIRRLVAQTQTAGGVYLPDSQAHKTNEGEVIAVGPGRVTESGTKVPVNVSVGDKVLLPEYGGQTLKLGSEEFSLFRDEDILGKFEV